MKTLDLEQTKKFAKLCHLAYKSTQEIAEGVRPLGYELFHSFDNTQSDIEGYIAEGKDSILLVFRGTDSPTDFFTDISILLSPYPKRRCPFFKPRVHSGFLKGFRSVEQEVYRKIDELRAARPSLRKFEITGFSMGGSLGAIAALALKSRYGFPVHFVSFGMPRTGNRWFVRGFRKQVDFSWNILNDRDIIGQVPPKSFGYRHIGTKVLIDDNSRLIVEPNFFEKLEASIESVIELLSTLSLDAHMIENYVKALDMVNRQ